ncbi:hypothetical protein QBL02_08490 [Leucobacter sp. UT-8R-CII-1-4]|uniref:DUF6414 family protein n=1 Tax=Leucobacter sp. UT-8R-CII-1-4 TaxID=3040075 RepID=UPI0024A8BF6E|nr:hypothetical protein [Leucobacter sp. UT-8R-CII-1-4]MDI6023581.1 hypothetical protein [Leucobacter sp. UT-8R-CII-1-4]
MSLRDRWRRWRNRPKKQKEMSKPTDVSKDNLREFVYLDEVTLTSLLSSIKGDLREGRSESSSDEFQAELEASLEASNPLAGKAGASSRFQTTNSTSIQTSRKSTVQSWFRDFRAIPGLRLVDKSTPERPASSLEALLSTTDTSLLLNEERLVRGELIEFRVRLSTDPVFHLSTVTSELSGMADDYPEMFAAQGGAAALQEVQPVKKILERLLAGLVPIRAQVIDYSVINVENTRYIVHNQLIEELDVAAEPLELVGVTEHLAYWKDLRRVLFSEAEFTVLGRISRSGVQASWTPVKLADLFREMVPDLVGQIHAAGRVSFTPQKTAPDANSVKLRAALLRYHESVTSELDVRLNAEQDECISEQLDVLSLRSASVSDQKTAFKLIRTYLEGLTDKALHPDRDLEIREEARAAEGLSLFPVLESQPSAASSNQKLKAVQAPENLIDTEIIAIYW